MKRHNNPATMGGIISGKMKIVRRFESLPRPEKKLNVGEIAQRYFSASNQALGYELGNEILKSPEKAELIISEWKKNKSTSVELLDFHRNVEKTINENEERIKNGKTVIKIPTWEKLSQIIGGFNPGRLIVVTAKTGVGKTNLALNIGIKAAQKFPVLYFNMEMMPQDVFERMIKSVGKITSAEWNNGSFVEKGKLSLVGNVFNGQEISNTFLISNGKALSIEEISSTIVQRNDELNLGLVIVDYDQKIRTENKFKGEQWQQLQRAGEELEEIAKYCEVPIILLAQANDDGNIRASQRIQQSAATHLNFFQDENDKKFYLEAKKNRFGKINEKIEVIYKPEMSFCAEGEIYDPVFPETNDQDGKRRGVAKSILSRKTQRVGEYGNY
jgi:replicative DNA helicase